MDAFEKPLPLILIAGPTASGKSALALALSRHLPVTIINADASQVYADLRIVSARPSAAEEAQAPHKLFGHVDGAVAYSAATWAADARKAIVGARAASRLPILVGGTGLYVRTLLDGIAPVPEIDPAIRSRVRALCVDTAFSQLTHEDEPAAHRLHPTDRTRIARALEVILSTGKPLAHWQMEKAGGIADQVRLLPMLLLPPRVWLYDRCDQRFDMMLKHGGINEVKALLARGLHPDLPVMRAIGVREITAMIEAPETMAEHSNRARIATRQFAKRQFTWFRNQSPSAWPRFEQQLDNDSINDLVIKLRDTALTS
jgi:tRNA dimethylallyltransferase